MPKAKAAFIKGVRQVALGEIEVPDPGAGEALVQVRRSGICGSDLHMYFGRWGAPKVVPGHEIAGEVLGVGPGVTSLAPGEAVCVEPMLPCWKCEACRRGDTNRCRRRGFISGSRHGGFAELLTAPAYALHQLPPSRAGARYGGQGPPNVSLDQGALMEPLSVSGRGVRLGQVGPDDAVLVIGGGTIGLAAIAAARAYGARTILCSAKHEHQAAMAKTMGADALVTVDPEKLPGQVKELTQGGADVAIETVGGAADTMTPAAKCLRDGGRLVLLGAFPEAVEVELGAVVYHEITVIGSNCYGATGGVRDFQHSLDLVASGKVDLSPLITHRFALDDMQRAFEAAADKSTGAIKVMIEPSA